MRKIKFDKNYLAHLREPLKVGDIIEVTDMHGTKYTLMVCIDEDNSTSCGSCVFGNTEWAVCEETISTSFDKYGRFFSPCSSLLLNDGKDYKLEHCIYYKNMDSILEGL